MYCTVSVYILDYIILLICIVFKYFILFFLGGGGGGGIVKYHEIRRGNRLDIMLHVHTSIAPTHICICVARNIF